MSAARPAAAASADRRGFVPVLSHRLEYGTFVPEPQPPRGRPTIVLLHDGLGSLSAWQDFPRRLADDARCTTIAYSRAGHGQSDPRAGALRPDHLHAEACAALPELLLHLQLENPVLVGDREGASIALIHAASGFSVRGIVAITPRVRHEPTVRAAIRVARDRYDAGELRSDIARHHRAPDALVEAWSGWWMSDVAREWSLEPVLPDVRCPLLLLQGEQDRAGSLDQLVMIARTARGRVDSVAFSGLGDTPWREAPEAVAAAIATFVESLAEP